MRNEYVERTSICKVIQDYNGQKWLSRLADIEKDKVVRFVFDEDEPWYFDNRNRLHFKDGPDEIGQIGVWHWTATPRDTDYEKDFIDSVYVADIQPIEIIVIPEVTSSSMLAEKLKSGVPCVNHGIQVLYCYSMKKSGYSGVLIQDQQMETTGGLAKIRDDVVSIPLYSVDISETIRTEGQQVFLRSLILPPTSESLLIKSPFEVIRGIFLKRSSWAAVKSAGLTKGEHKRLRSYLTEITDVSLYEEIADSCGISVDEAKAQVNSFVENVQLYLEGSDLDTQVLESVVESHEDFRKRAEAIVAENWHKENEDVIIAGKKEADKYRREAEEEKKKLKTLQEEIISAQNALDKIREDIDMQEKVATDVEQKVLQRISDARKDAAEFIASMAFVTPVYAQPRISTGKTTAAVLDDGNSNSNCGAYKVGKPLEEDNLDHHKTWSDTLITIEDELASAGVDKKLCAGLAAFLFCAYKNRVSVLLAGPNAVDIVDALSSALIGKMADRIECSGTYIKTDVPEALRGQIITVKNALQSSWIDHITDILDDEENYYVFVNSYVEDLAIEPQGLYNYMIPVFTDLFVTERASHQYYGGIAELGYSDFETGTMTDEYSKLLSVNGASKFFVSQVEHVLGDMARITGYKVEWDYYYAILPYLIATGHKEGIIEHIRQESKISRDCKEIILNYLGAEE